MTQIINPERYQNLVSEAWTADFSGWDFCWLKDRLLQEDPPWDYPTLVKSHFSKAKSLLDMGTGGGELLASLAPLPADTHATESYAPNQAIAMKRLSPLKVTVHPIKEEATLPFNDHHFDLIINRHESYKTDEVYRILKPGGVFITQQVSGRDNLELNQVLEDEISFPYTDWGLAVETESLIEAGFIIERADEVFIPSVFKDIGAVVYYLKAIPWQVEGFSPETHAAGLIQLHNLIESRGEFIAAAHRFLVVAHKEEI